MNKQRQIALLFLVFLLVTGCYTPNEKKVEPATSSNPVITSKPSQSNDQKMDIRKYSYNNERTKSSGSIVFGSGIEIHGTLRDAMFSTYLNFIWKRMGNPNPITEVTTNEIHDILTERKSNKYKLWFTANFNQPVLINNIISKSIALLFTKNSITEITTLYIVVEEERTQKYIVFPFVHESMTEQLAQTLEKIIESDFMPEF